MPMQFMDSNATATPAAVARENVVSRSCPVCRDEDGQIVLREGDWRLRECATCGLAYLPEVPAPEELEGEGAFEWALSFQTERRRRWQERPLARLWTSALVMLKPSRESRALRQVRRFAKSGRFLDIGAGDGRLSAAALRAGYDVTCVELSPRMAGRAAARVGRERVHVGRVEEVDLPGPFDVAVAVSLLEHEPDPRRLLMHTRGLLGPEGIFAIKVPNYNTYLRKLRGAQWSGYRWPEHVQYFNPNTLRRLVEETGYDVVHVSANPLGDNFWLIARAA